MLERVLQGVTHEQMAVEHLRVERRIAGRQGAVGQTVHLLPLVVEDVYRAVPEIRSIQQRGSVFLCPDRQAFVDRTDPLGLVLRR